MRCSICVSGCGRFTRNSRDCEEGMRRRSVGRIVKIAVIGLVAVGIFGWVVMSLWNWLAPAVFGLHAITYWQALGLLVLSKILFGGMRGPSGGGGRWRQRM